MNDTLKRIKMATELAIEAITLLHSELEKQQAEVQAMRDELVKRDKARITRRYPWIKWRP
ncbi:hypothetical protein SAMN05192583_0051 [Sphingomonas gellani]|uniref:Transposase n=1 Tax=Sphingomonas gellani TaxID=1166340 RepID=A0A1H7Y1D1_9SPHN|nr:hypothetical protein [Sphingomonas gellani]SEM40006.1 hypothetical protein SAMN05192583_0051 [Sphingomonas gellani]